jgi:hypothetical protein
MARKKKSSKNAGFSSVGGSMSSMKGMNDMNLFKSKFYPTNDSGKTHGKDERRSSS